MANISALSLTITPSTALYTSPMSDSSIAVSTSTEEGRTEIVLDFNGGDGIYARDLGTIFSWPTSASTKLCAWQPSVLELPETIYNRASDWIDGGTPGAKYVQGYSVEADSMGSAKTITLQSSDDLSIHTLNESPATFNKQSRKVFSCTPFIAHSVRRICTDGVPWRVFNEDIIFQPFPELTMLWQTELNSLGMTGWNHLREMNISHISTADLTLTLSFDSWPSIKITIPNSGGAQAKEIITPDSNKWKLVGFSITSTEAFRLFLEDIEVKVGGWNRTSEYTTLHPFGGQSKTGAVV